MEKIAEEETNGEVVFKFIYPRSSWDKGWGERL